MRAQPWLASCLALLLSPAALAERPVGQPILDAIVVDITDEGFDVAADGLPGLIPETFDIPEVHLYHCQEQCFLGACWCWYAYQVDVTNGYASFATSYIDLVPGSPDASHTALLNLSAGLVVSVNRASDPMYVDASAGVIVDGLASTNCDVWVDPFPVTVNATVGLKIDGGRLDATVPTPTYNLGLTNNHIKVSGCFIADFENVANFFGFSLYDLVIDAVLPQVDDAIAEFPPQVEALIEDAFSQAIFADTFDLAGVELDMIVAPTDVHTTPEGLRLSIGGAFHTEKDACIEGYGIDGSLATPSNLPAIGQVPGNLPFEGHMGVYVDDDFLNNALFALWYGGLLCYEVNDDSELDLPIAINTALLGLLAPGVYDELLPDIVPLEIVTRPARPPEITVTGNNDVNVVVNDLGLDMFAELDGRQTRLVNLNLALDAGVDLNFDGNSGVLALDVHLDGSRLTPKVTFNEYTAEANGTLENSFTALFDQIVGPLLGDALGGLAFPLPAFEGIGLADLVVRPAGSADDRIGVYGAVGTSVPYYDPNAGCGCGGDSEGCDTGCTTGSLPSRGLLVLFPAVIALLRRRK